MTRRAISAGPHREKRGPVFERHGPRARGLHSSTFRLNVSAFCGIGSAWKGLFRGGLGGVWGNQGLCRVFFVSETAQVELKSGRV